MSVQNVQCPPGWDWKVSREIGSGSYGSVYLIERKVGNETMQSAMKIVRLPATESEAEQLMQRTGKSAAEIAEYYDALGDSLLREIQLMTRLRGDSHIVSYEDHYVEKHASGIGMDIYIRMEYLTSLPRWMNSRQLSVQDVVKLGIHLCSALETCALNNIVHRDIKPDNIFVAANGAFKLGDFGIAQRLDHLIDPEDMKLGSLNYIAPEVRRGDEFDARADIYGLGMVMYRLLNGGRIPFIPAVGDYSAEQENLARQRRFSGEKLPKPANSGDVLWAIVEKACSYHASARYASAADMRKALEAIAAHPETSALLPVEGAQPARDKDTSRRSLSGSGSGPNGTEVRTQGSVGTSTPTYTPPVTPEPEPEPDYLKEEPVKKKNFLPFIIIGAAVVVAIIILVVLLGGRRDENGEVIVPPLEVQLEAADEKISISAKGGSGPYEAVIYSGSYAIETLKFSSSAEADELISGTTYSVKVSDTSNQIHEANVTIPEKEFNDSTHFSLLDMTVYECERQALNELDLSTLMARNRAVPLPGNAISLSNASPARQSMCWHLIVYMKDSFDTPTDAEMQLVLRAADGTAVDVKSKLTMGNAGMEYRIKLDDLLNEMWTTCNEWVSGWATIEMYVDDSFVGETSFEIVTGEARFEE